MTMKLERQPVYPAAAVRPGEAAADTTPRRQQPINTLDSAEIFWSAVLGAIIGLGLAAAGLAIGLGVVGVASETHAYWYLSRSAGFVAYLLLWGSVVWGLLLSSKIGRGIWHAPALLDAHQFLSEVAVGFTLFHGLILMGDRYLSFPLLAVLAPFAGDYQPALVAAGQIALWLSLLLVVSSYLRKHVGQTWWRAIHFSSFAAYWLALLHSVLMGSDTQQVGVQVLYLATAGAVLFLTLYRFLDKARRVRKTQQSPT